MDYRFPGIRIELHGPRPAVVPRRQPPVVTLPLAGFRFPFADAAACGRSRETFRRVNLAAADPGGASIDKLVNGRRPAPRIDQGELDRLIAAADQGIGPVEDLGGEALEAGVDPLI